MTNSPAGFRSEPNPGVSTSAPSPVGPDFKSADRQFGWLVVNRWTYRPLRAVAKYVVPKVDQSGVEVSEDSTAGRGLLTVRPDTTSGAGAVLLIHGGGFVVGSNKEVLMPAIALARACGVPVFCPGYRLAPEHPFPAGLDDCHAGWMWLVENASKLGVDPAKIVVGGLSAGGGHAAALVQRLHDEGGVQPSGQLLFYPMLDDRTAARRDFDKPRHRVWSNRNNLFGWASYLGQEPGQPCPPYASPARRDDLSGLPPAWIGVGGADLFLDENRDYALRMKDAGGDVTFVEIDGGIHGFDLAQDSVLTKAFYASAADFTRRFTE